MARIGACGNCVRDGWQESGCVAAASAGKLSPASILVTLPHVICHMPRFLPPVVLRSATRPDSCQQHRSSAASSHRLAFGCLRQRCFMIVESIVFPPSEKNFSASNRRNPRSRAWRIAEISKTISCQEKRQKNLRAVCYTLPVARLQPTAIGWLREANINPSDDPFQHPARRKAREVAFEPKYRKSSFNKERGD